MSDLWAPLQQPGSLSSRIAARIEELIVGEQLRAGERLPSERELAATLGVSRPSLREALRYLAARGRVAIRHGQGVFVEADATTQLLQSKLAEDLLDLEEIYDMREVLEVPATGWAAEQRDREALRLVRAAYDELATAAAASEPDWPALQRLDAAFHESIVRAAGNRFLLRTLGVLNEVTRKGMETTLRMPGRLEASARDHARIMAAIRRHDVDEARDAARDHIRAARSAALARRAASAAPEQTAN